MTMRDKQGNLKPVAGTARAQRFPAPLAPEYARVDDRTSADQMSFALEFAKLLVYYDDSNQPSGSWSGFFERDLAFLLARIVTTDFQREHFQAIAIQTAVREGRADARETLKSIYRMISRIYHWHRWARDIAEKDLSDNPFRMTLQSVIQSDLSQYLGENMKSILERLPAARGIDDWPGYWSRWEASLPEVGNISRTSVPSFTPQVYDNPIDGLLAVLQGVHHANRKLQQMAQNYLEETINNRSDHPPHTALYIAFTKLMELLREKINGIPGKHLDFYYRNVLGLAERGNSPDVVHLSFEAAPQLREYILPAGTRVAAGKDAGGRLREYATDADLFINHARVDSMKALYLMRDRYATSAHARQRVMSVLALPKCDSEDGLSAPLRDAAAGWPAFGVDETSCNQLIQPQLNAELGFILASSVLLLQEGERNVTISIAFQDENSFETALQAYQDVAADVLDAPPAVELLLEDAFCLWLSGEKGWSPVTGASFRRHPVVGTTMEIEFTLQPADPPVVANPALAPEPRQAQWPMLKLALNPFARVFAYTFFKDLAIATIDIRAGARGLRKMQLRNDIGLLSAAQPFPIFGPVPVQGSYLLLGHPELQVKRIQHTALTLTWFNLPRPPASFASLYEAYNLGIEDESFKVRLSVFNSGAWVPLTDVDGRFPLFTRDFDRSGLLPATVMSFAVPELTPPAAELPAPPSVAEQLTEAQAPRGAIRLELAEPEFGFGHSVFPRLISDAAAANARAGKNGRHTPLPNPPFTPILKSLVLDYDAADRLDLSRPLPDDQPARFYHLCPFGFTEHQGRAAGMFTDVSEQGHLYLGVAEIDPQQSLTLLFHLRDSSFSPVPALRHHHHASMRPVRWRYLSRNEWKDFPAELLISDTTMGLTCSGILKFLLPEDITRENTVMPAGLCWIQAAAEQVTDIYWCRVVSIATQAVTATRLCDPHSDLVPAVLPAGSITQLVEKKPQIKSIVQPFDSRLGRSKESPDEFRTRVSERLRHKDRAIQNFDFERLVLDAFPEVGQVKCIGHNNSRGFPGSEPLEPGMLYLVVVPRLENCPDREPRLPQFVLKEIEQFIRAHTTIFVKDIHVINPVYETLKIFANVEFSGEGDASYYTDDLDAAISQYLQPWRHKPGEPMYIGNGQVQGYEVAKFIQQQTAAMRAGPLPYVRQLHKLVMLHTCQQEEGYVSKWHSVEDRVWASAPWSVLMPAVKHGIVAVRAGASTVDAGIRNLVVGNDFVMNGIGAKEEKEKSTERRYFVVIPRSAVLSAGRD
jgi:hypothetical protein